MKEGQIIDKFFVEKDGKMIRVIIRCTKKSDVKAVHIFFNKAIKETEFLARVTPVTLKEEKKWVNDAINKMKKNDMFQIMIEAEGKIVGSSSIARKDRQRHGHIGDFGIAILQEYTGMGIGRRVMELLEKQARPMGFSMIEMSVYGRNKIAKNLYRKMGFKEFGKLPKSIKTKKAFDDEIFMYKVLK